MVLINSRDGRGRPCQLLGPFVRSLARVIRPLLCCVLRQPIHYLVSRNRNNFSVHPFRIYLYSFAIFIQRKRPLIVREDQIFPRYVCAVDLNPISCRFPSMTRWCLLSLVTGECVFEMRNCLWGMSVSQRSERRAESDAANARKGKGRLLREVGGRDAL